jgi:hypothetical protein
MKSKLIFIALSLGSLGGLAQKGQDPLPKLSIAPAVGTRLSTAFGLVDIQLSGLVQYALSRRFSLGSHTAISWDLNRFEAFKNVEVNRSVTVFQKLGMGTSFQTRNSSHAIFLMAGGKYFSYAASLKNSKLEDNVQTNFTTFAWDTGLLYNLKIGRGDTFFSGRVYAPVFEGKWVLLENTSIELGFGLKLN